MRIMFIIMFGLFGLYFGMFKAIIPDTSLGGPNRASQWTERSVRVYSHVKIYSSASNNSTTTVNKVYRIYFTP